MTGRLIRAPSSEIAPITERHLVGVELLDALNDKELRSVCSDASHYAMHKYACKADLQNVLMIAESQLEQPAVQRLIANLKLASERASLGDVKREIAMLLAAFPGKEDLSAFAQLLVGEVFAEKPTRLCLAAACRSLRRRSKFRPSISEVLERLTPDYTRVLTMRADDISSLGAAVRMIRHRLECGHYSDD